MNEFGGARFVWAALCSAVFTVPHTVITQAGGDMAQQGIESLPFISEGKIAETLKWQPLIGAMEDAMIAFSAGKVVQPVRQLIPVPGQDAIIAAMPAIGEAMAVKVVTLYHSNAGTDIPTHQAIILLLDSWPATNRLSSGWSRR